VLETPPPQRPDLPRGGLVGFALDFAARVESHRTVERAGSLAFDLFLSLLPLFAFAGWVLVHYAGPDLRTQATAALVRFAPGGAGAIVDAQFELLDQSGRALAPASVVAFVWSASAGLHTLLAALRTIHGARALPWWNVRLRALVFVAVTGAAGPIAAFFLARAEKAPVAVLRQAADLASSLLFQSSAFVSAFFLVALFLAGAHRVALSHATRWRASFLASALWCLASYGFGRYVAVLGRYSVFYGSLASVVLLLLWIWLSALVMLVAAEFDAAVRAWHETRRRRTASDPPSRSA
jgi:membrane protein